MRAYINGKLYDFLDQPIVILFDEGEQDLIARMDKEAKYFSSYNTEEVSVSQMEDLLEKMRQEVELIDKGE